MNFFKKYPYLVVEGNIGAGKTTLCQRLQADFGGQLILETFEDNPFLAKFYDNPTQYALAVELFFMTERHRQLENALQASAAGMIADYFFEKTLLFAKNNLDATEFELFTRIFSSLNARFQKPNLLIYLHRSVPHLQRNIAVRGRTYEQGIAAEYLAQIENTYFDFFNNPPQFPILWIDVADKDFIQENEVYQRIVTLLQGDYSVGISKCSL